MSEIYGIFNIHKPAGLTSFDVVRRIRRRLGVKRVGHCGSLDPFATGVLLVCAGRSTKQSGAYLLLSKTYRAAMRLGTVTDTDDITGAVIAERDWSGVTRGALEDAFSRFRGEIAQTVPAYSAVKRNGRALYSYARSGIAVELPVKRVVISRLDITGFTPPEVFFEMECSSGTYVRSLARDIGALLGCGGTLVALERTSVGPHALRDALPLEWALTASPSDLVAARAAV